MEMEKEKEKEKGNVCSPETVLEDFLRSAESETSSSKASTSESEAELDPQLNSSRRIGFFQLLRFKSKQQLATLHPFNALKLSKKFSSMREEVDLNYFKPQWKNFSFLELQSATDNFCQGNLIGKGGYAEVYKARSHEGQLLAIKRFTKGPLGEKVGDFLNSNISMM